MRDYNFFEPLQRRKGIHINVKSPVFFGCVVIFLIILASAAMVAQNAIIKTQLSGVKEDLAQLQASSDYQEALMLQDSISALMSYDQLSARALERIEQGKSILNTGFLKGVSDAIPSTASYREINVTSAQANFIFRVPDRRTAAELHHDLENSGLFLQTTLVSVRSNQDGSGGYDAAISCIIKAGEPQ
ncbi:MAG TPA: hypothetical protein VN381_07060 [Anaerovoracaceae bacterium]|nr:hypothetical protein [Anaerovoracaceae bacterium]